MHIFKDLFVSKIHNKMDEKASEKLPFLRLNNVFCFKGHSRVKRILQKKKLKRIGKLLLPSFFILNYNLWDICYDRDCKYIISFELSAKCCQKWFISSNENN